MVIVVVASALLRSDPVSDAAADLRAPGADRLAATTTTIPPTTTTTIPALAQPAATMLPPLPGGSLGPGANNDVVKAYQQRLADVHFDPGRVDGRYGGAMVYAVQALQKILGLPRTGRLGFVEATRLAMFQYPQPFQPTGEANRTEIDITKQVLTLYENYQVRLITTVSTGAGELYCYNTPRDNPNRRVCEYANTPPGKFAYTRYIDGWDKSPLGQLYKPFYFNSGIAVHGYLSVPPQPASHGCTRIPMHIAEYFHTLVHKGDPVYVFGGKPAQVVSSSPIAPTTTTVAPPAPPPVTTPPTTAPPPTTPPST